MSELDNQRRQNFLNSIKDTQIIITCTENIAIPNVAINRYEIKEGKVFSK